MQTPEHFLSPDHCSKTPDHFLRPPEHFLRPPKTDIVFLFKTDTDYYCMHVHIHTYICIYTYSMHVCRPPDHFFEK